MRAFYILLAGVTIGLFAIELYPLVQQEIRSLNPLEMIAGILLLVIAVLLSGLSGGKD